MTKLDTVVQIADDVTGQPVPGATHPVASKNVSGIGLIPGVVITDELGNIFNAANPLPTTSSGGSGGTSSTFGAAFPTTGTAIGLSDGTNMVALTKGQALSAASIPVVLPATQITSLTPPTSVGVTSVVPGSGATNLGKLYGTASVTGDVGVGTWGIRNLNLTSLTTTDLGYIPISLTNAGQAIVVPMSNSNLTAATQIGKVQGVASGTSDTGVTPLYYREAIPSATGVAGTDGQYSRPKTDIYGTAWVNTLPTIGGGWSVSSATAQVASVTTIKSSQGVFGGYIIYNPNATVSYIQVFNVASGSITLGTTPPTYVITIPATSTANVEFTVGIQHSTAINVYATTTATGNTAPGTGLTCTFLFR